ncbi:MAG: hypothetical protein ISEC1_P1543 [Thiomicrorhabdus sp.]|nr:MAG: hypothetical protein ISEC1_P1543 [Thiomicrorhabdus sp.]
MISQVNSSSTAYIPASHPAVEPVALEVKEKKGLQSQSVQGVNYSQSITAKPSSSQSANLSDSDSENQPVKNVDADVELAKQQEQVRQVVDQLKARDREVRTHEMAHLSSAGSYAIGGMNLSYQKGPDGQQYAIGGSVQIDTSAILGDPEETLQKGRVVQQAALAPAEPSNQDRKVASAAAQVISSAQSQILKEAQTERVSNEQDESGEVEQTDSVGQKGIQSRADSSNQIEVSGSLNTPEEKAVQVASTPTIVARIQFDMRMQVAGG